MQICSDARALRRAVASVVSLTDYRTEGKELVEEGVGSGIVWDRLVVLQDKSCSPHTFISQTAWRTLAGSGTSCPTTTASPAWRRTPLASRWAGQFMPVYFCMCIFSFGCAP